MPKTIYQYCHKKSDLISWYDKLYNKKDLHNHFFFNRDYQNEKKSEILQEINKNYSKDFLHNDLVEVEYIKKKKIFKDYEDMEKELKKIKKDKTKIMKLIRCYVHPDDCKNLRKKTIDQLIQFVQTY